ncbi:MAG: glycosyltransferase [Bacteroidota bacterium]
MPLEIQERTHIPSEPEALKKAYLIETAWEVCNQVGGIYTVIRSKVPAMMSQWKDRYCLIGPLAGQDINAEFDPIDDLTDSLGQAVAEMRNEGWEVKYGTWLVTGRPKVVLLDIAQIMDRIPELKGKLYNEFGIAMHDDELQENVLSFAALSEIFLRHFIKKVDTKKYKVITHFHEWMASIPILSIKKDKLPIKTVFTTHATAIGRYLAMNDPDFYSNLPDYQWEQSANEYNILPMAKIERFCGQMVDVLTTVSDVTARECKYFFGRSPDVVTPNGLNIERFVAYHEVQNLHQHYKSEIHEFVMGHFFHNSPFDLNNVIYFFTSGRYEYRNKGFDITLDALQLLNQKMKRAKMKETVVMFFITKKPTWSINPVVLESRGVMEEVRKNCENIQRQIGDQLFYAAASEKNNFKLPDLNDLVDDYWKLKYRRVLQSWKSESWPIVVTHNLVDDKNDQILNYLRENQLVNNPLDRVKVVYHPDFIDSTNPLFGMDYSEFVRGCHLGVFPSHYEPWGYTPLECLARGVPAITSDLAGFGNYLGRNFEDIEDSGGYVLKRYKRKPETVVKDLAKMMFNFIKKTRRERMVQRNKAEDLSESFDWSQLVQYYNLAYAMSLQRYQSSTST